LSLGIFQTSFSLILYDPKTTLFLFLIGDRSSTPLPSDKRSPMLRASGFPGPPLSLSRPPLHVTPPPFALFSCTYIFFLWFLIVSIARPFSIHPVHAKLLLFRVNSGVCLPVVSFLSDLSSIYTRNQYKTFFQLYCHFQVPPCFQKFPTTFNWLTELLLTVRGVPVPRLSFSPHE